MRLKKLEISGFKSFADRTVLNVDRGITGVVGPNGCGKSNVVDAIRWVFGEQSASSIRGKKSQDFVFAGATNRLPSNLAEVTITLTDAAEDLPLGCEEVAITRRLHRSGDSEYLINRQPVRLKDVQDLLMDSGLGKNSFAIFEQGKMDKVIHDTPLERRSIFEEAAGIQRFLQRKKEVTKSLEKTEENVSRASDIYGEVNRQVETLEKQAEEAREYKQRKAEWEALEKQLICFRYQKAKKMEGELKVREKEVKQLLETLNEKEKRSAAEGVTLKEKLEAAEELFNQRKENAYQIRTEREVAFQKQRTQQVRAKEVAEQIRRMGEELAALTTKKVQLKEEKERDKKELQQVQEKMKVSSKEYQEAKKLIAKTEEEMSEMRENQQKVQAERLTSLQGEHKAVSEIKELRIRLETHEERLALLDKRLKQLTEEELHISEKLKASEAALKESTSKVAALKKAFSDVEERQVRLKQKQQTLEQQRQAAARTLTEKEAREKVLAKLKEEKEGFSSGTKELLKASQDKGPLAGKLQELSDYLGSQPRACIDLLSPYGETLLVKTKKEFSLVLAYAKEKKLKEFSLFCLEMLPASKKLEEHLIQNYRTAEGSEEGFKTLKMGEALSCGEGVRFDRNGVFFVEGKSSSNAFLRETELQELKTAIIEAKKVFQESEEAMAQIEEESTLQQQRKAEIDRELREAEMSLVEAKMNNKQFVEGSEKREKERKELSQEAKERQEQITVAQKRLQELEQFHLKTKKEAQAVETQSERVLEALKKIERAHAEQKDSVIQKSGIHRMQEERIKQLEKAVELAAVKEEEAVYQEGRLNRDLEAQRAFLENFSKDNSEEKELLEAKNRAVEEAEERCSQVAETMTSYKKQVEESQKSVKNIQDQLKGVEKEQVQLQVKGEQFKAQITAFETALVEEQKMAPEKALEMEYNEEVPLEQMEKMVHQLRKKLESYGNINMASIDEYAQVKERKEFLESQLKDLSGSREQMLELIRELEGKSRTLFKDVFAQVRQSFQKNFATLFEGGEADLVLTEGEDLLEAGIEIIAKPPGKKMRSISLLSGGEKCLTATALLFSLFEVKTAPFCVLDEIDAPLDEANIDRFLRLVKQFVGACQFVIVTHNKRTMSIADQIFGISMQERGVSKLVSVAFKKETAPLVEVS